MLKDENLRFMNVVEDLRQKGVITDYVHLAQILETNKAGISDIKAGRKKISIELLRRMKFSYPSIDIEWIVTGNCTPEDSCQTPETSEADLEIRAENRLLKEQLEESYKKISEKDKEIGRLETIIRQLRNRLDEIQHDGSKNAVMIAADAPMIDMTAD